MMDCCPLRQKSSGVTTKNICCSYCTTFSNGQRVDLSTVAVLYPLVVALLCMVHFPPSRVAAVPTSATERVSGKLRPLGPLEGLMDAVMAPTDRMPYMVSLRKHSSQAHMCSGVLVDSQHVLTAAHCVEIESAYSAGHRPILRIGEMNATAASSDNEEVMVAEKTIIHPDWDGKQRSPFNVALVKLPKKSEKTVPKMLEDHFKPQTGQKLVALGWGSSDGLQPLGAELFGHLRIEPEQFIKREHCNEKQLWDGEVPENLVCGLNTLKRASCVVDSGAPLLLPDMPKSDIRRGLPRLDIITGIHLDGAPCGDHAKPNMYLDLRTVKGWIHNQIKQSGQQ